MNRESSPEEIEVWHWDLDQPELARAGIAVLSEEERSRAERFRMPAHRVRFVCGRAGLRIILASYLGVEAIKIRLAYQRLGKPILEWPPVPGFYFNLAHSAGLAVLAVRRGAEVGVDVEQIRAVTNLMGLSRRFFAPVEAAILEPCDEALRQFLFFRFWTCKEAVLKGLSLGLTYPLEKVEVPWLLIGKDSGQFPLPLATAGEIQISSLPFIDVDLGPQPLPGQHGTRHPLPANTRWWVWEWQPRAGFVAAVASCQPWEVIRLRSWPECHGAPITTNGAQ